MPVIFVTTDLAKWGVGTGAPITAVQVDNNFWDLLSRIVNIETNPPVAVSIQSIDVNGTQMSITLTDATIEGPFTLPIADLRILGEWTPSTVYKYFNFFTNSGNLYYVRHDHISDLTFDPAATDIDGLRYALALSPPSQPNDLHVFINGIMNNAQLILRTAATRKWQIPDNATGSLFEAGVAATAQTIVTLRKNGASIGTLTWAIAGTIPTVVFNDPITFEIGDKFSMTGPAVADATLADISFDILGNRIT